MSLRPVIEIYIENADFWAAERSRSSFFEKKYIDWIVVNGVQAGEVLDLGCGSGRPIAAYLISRGFRVTGLDAAAPMLRHARESFPTGTWLEADMRYFDLGKKFNAIIAWDSFFHLTADEQRQMFPRFRNHLQPGGLLLFTSGTSEGTAIGEINGRPLYHASLEPSEYRQRLAAEGFEAIHFDANDSECGNHSIWRCQLGTK